MGVAAFVMEPSTSLYVSYVYHLDAGPVFGGVVLVVAEFPSNGADVDELQRRVASRAGQPIGRVTILAWCPFYRPVRVS